MKLLNLFKRKTVVEETISDEEINSYEEYKEDQEQRLKLIERIVGESPIEQIDYIINFGMKTYVFWYKTYETGLIHQPATVRENIEVVASETEKYAIGRVGNPKLINWSYSRKYYDKDGNELFVNEFGHFTRKESK